MMMHPTALTLAGLALAGLVACADATTEKPATDPDLAVTAAKADSMSNVWTTHVGELALGATLQDEIDFPDYYLGRVVELRAGQKLDIKVNSNRKSLVRVYGPATGSIDGQPTFGKPLVKTETKKLSGAQRATLAVEAPADGTYMLLYGPSNVWHATYDITATCVAGCLPADACSSDDACPSDEFCGWNGVACIRAPCDAAYDVCQARHDASEGCSRDRECAEGLRCGEAGTCVGGTVALGGACGVAADCQNGFCGCVDATCSGMVCKAYAAEGETCGGFRPASSVTMCSSKFDCAAPYDIIADIPGRCGKFTTVTELLANPAAFEGRYVAVKGRIDASAAICTKLGCGPQNPCCNQCGASLRLYDDASQLGVVTGVDLDEDGAPLHCGGNECSWREHCTVAPGNAWVSGWFRLEGGVTPTLSIDRRFAY